MVEKLGYLLIGAEIALAVYALSLMTAGLILGEYMLLPEAIVYVSIAIMLDIVRMAIQPGEKQEGTPEGSAKGD